MFIDLIFLVLAWVVVWSVIIIKRYRQELLSYWREPVLKHPVLIFESDDWGAGPLIQANVLQRISSLLLQYSDKHGHHPIMTLGVILSIPDFKKIKLSGFKTYYWQGLDQPIFSSIKAAMLDGKAHGVFDLQLHGMAHYWPANLMHLLQIDAQLKQRLNEEEFLVTETLPSVIQSRWTNTENLPTVPLSHEEIGQAVGEEVNLFKELFGFNPEVVVPPTFVWDRTVERYWKQRSVNYLVTPGKCFERRDKEGKPCGSDQKITSGQLSESGLIYFVRNDYFEPSLGHSHDMALSALAKKTQLAQPALLEIHRVNFIQNDDMTEKSLKELELAISRSIDKYPDLLFLSTKELADKYRSNNDYFIEKSYRIRFLVSVVRLWANNAIRKWLYLSGLFLPLRCLIYWHYRSWHRKIY